MTHISLILCNTGRVPSYAQHLVHINQFLAIKSAFGGLNDGLYILNAGRRVYVYLVRASAPVYNNGATSKYKGFVRYFLQPLKIRQIYEH